MKTDVTRRLIGGLAALLGVWWTWTAVVPAITKISGGRDSLDPAFLLTMVPMMTIPGVLAVVFGVRLFREMRESSLRWVMGVLAVWFAFFLSSRASEVFPSFLPERLESSVYLFVASLIALVSYLLGLRILIRHLTGEDRRFRSLLGRGALVLMALQVWVLLSGIFEVYSPTKEGHEHVPKEPWGILGLIVPIAVTYALYRVLARQLTKAPPGVASET